MSPTNSSHIELATSASFDQPTPVVSVASTEAMTVDLTQLIPTSDQIQSVTAHSSNSDPNRIEGNAVYRNCAAGRNLRPIPRAKYVIDDEEDSDEESHRKRKQRADDNSEDETSDSSDEESTVASNTVSILLLFT